MPARGPDMQSGKMMPGAELLTAFSVIICVIREC